MKLSQILPLVVGSAVAGVVASMSPAQAISWNFTYTNDNNDTTTLILTSTDTATDINGYYQITSLSGTQFRGQNATISLLPINTFLGNDNLFNPLGTIDATVPLVTNGGIGYQVDSTHYSISYSRFGSYRDRVNSTNPDYNITNFSVTSATPVPFDTTPRFLQIPTITNLQTWLQSVS